jgi:hypothetical protein
VFPSLCCTTNSLGITLCHFTTRARKRRLDDGNEDSSIADIIFPPGWIIHRPMFNLSKQGGEWSTFLRKSTFTNQVVYPNVVSKLKGDIFKSGESKWVQAYVDQMNWGSFGLMSFVVL